MTKIIIDSIELDVPPDTLLIEACGQAGIEIPRFCYHDRLSVAGNCRMCLVEVKGGPPKPTASCAMRVKDLRPGPQGEPPEILTKSPMVKKARKGVMEFLLINHPLDCPICDQGGECDLQDQALGFGYDSSRFHENKRAVEEKYIGPLVKTNMTRCIHCTRCIRFTTEVAGTAEMGATGRGEDMEITTYLESAMTSELQTCVVDLCPVGALLSRPYDAKGRPWELTHTATIDVMDALGSAIRLDTRGPEVMRIQPRVNDEVNEEWISDKTRHVVDGLRTQRLDRPYVRDDGRLRPASWAEAFEKIAEKIEKATPERIGAMAGDLAGIEEMFALKMLMASLGSPSIDCRQEGAYIDPNWGRASYLFNTTVAGIEQAEALVIIGSNPRLESPVLNARIRKRWLKGNFPIFLIGEKVDLTYPYEYLGEGPEALEKLQQYLPLKLERPMMLMSPGALVRPDGAAVLAHILRMAHMLGVIRENWNGFNMLHTAAARVGGLDIGFVPGHQGQGTKAMSKNGAMDVIFNLGADEVNIEEGPFVVYIGTHGDRGAHRADVILPGATYTEKSATYVNTEGRVQRTNRAIAPPGEAREDWAILRALSARLRHQLPFESLNELRSLIMNAYPHLATVNAIQVPPIEALEIIAARGGELLNKPFRTLISDFYLTNPIARASAIMAECSALKTKKGEQCHA